MISNASQYVVSVLNDNIIAQGGLVISAASFILYWLRSLPGRIWRIIIRFTTVKLTVPDSYESFGWFVLWSRRQKTILRVNGFTFADNIARRRADYCIPESIDGTKRSRKDDQTLYPINTRQVFFYRKRLVSVEITREKVDGGSVASSRFFHDTVSMTVFPGNRSILSAIIDDVFDHFKAESGDDIVPAYSNEYSRWEPAPKIRRRAAHTVHLPGAMLSDILADARRFFDDASWYRDRGVPWRRGFFFRGLPGTGKSTVSQVIAYELEVPIMVLRLSSTTDEYLASLVARLPDKCLLVLEDIDCVKGPVSSRDAPTAGGADSRPELTLSGLLNAIDGIGAGEGRLLIVTSNHPDSIDPALIRPGRIDRTWDFTFSGAEEASAMFARFFPDASPELASEFGKNVAAKEMTAAKIQGLLLLNRDDPGAASVAPLMEAVAHD